MDMKSANKNGYIVLTEVFELLGKTRNKPVFIKADKISCIGMDIDNTTLIDMVGGFQYIVKEPPQDIVEQLENIHPSLR